MKTLICCKTGKTVTLENKIGGGGEGAIWRTNQDGKLAKVYQEKLENIKIKKLKVMVDYPPTDPSKSRNHISYAWPESLLKDKNQIVGFLMPEIKGSQAFLKISNIKERKDSKLEIDWKFLHITAMNIANMIRNLHAEGYVVGDLKPDNIMVNSLALPSIVDTDSFQLRDPQSGNIYRCPVTSENFTPPEMIDEDITEFDQTVYHDAFRLGALIHLLLTSQYYHQGQWCGTGEPPTVVKKIREGLWPYGTNSLIKPSDFSIPLKVMHPRVQKLFLRCFNNGHKNPRLRPTADDWHKALEKAVNDLTQCNRVETHIYAPHYGQCYWCERAWELKKDTFRPRSGYKRYDPTKTPPPPIPRPTTSKKSSDLSIIPEIMAYLPTLIVLLIVVLIFIFRLPTTVEKTVLNENFTNPSSRWSINEFAKFKDGGLFQEVLNPDLGYLSYWDTNYSSYNIQKTDYSVDIKKINGPNTTPYGIIARVQENNTQNFYFFIITSNGYFSMGKRSRNNWDHIINGKKHNSINQGNYTINRLRIVTEGNLITGFINGKRVGSFRDSSYKDGMIGVYSQSEGKPVAVYFDNIKVIITVPKD